MTEAFIRSKYTNNYCAVHFSMGWGVSTTKTTTINNAPNREKIKLNQPTISPPTTDRSTINIGVTNSIDFFDENCLIMPR
jgi:hypothetical protein